MRHNDNGKENESNAAYSMTQVGARSATLQQQLGGQNRGGRLVTTQRQPVLQPSSAMAARQEKKGTPLTRRREAAHQRKVQQQVGRPGVQDDPDEGGEALVGPCENRRALRWKAPETCLDPRVTVFRLFYLFCLPPARPFFAVGSMRGG